MTIKTVVALKESLYLCSVLLRKTVLHSADNLKKYIIPLVGDAASKFPTYDWSTYIDWLYEQSL